MSRATTGPYRLLAGFLGAAAVGTTLVLLLGGTATRLLGRSATYLPASLAVFAAAMTLAGRALWAHEPHPRFGVANQVTTVRLALVSLLAALVPEAPTTSSAWTIVAAIILLAALDGLDGRLARRTRLSSPFGARFDMETDAALVLVLSLLVWTYGKAGPWVLACGLMRYGFGAARWAFPWMSGELSPTLRGRAVAVAQYFGLAAALAPVVSWPASATIAALTLAVLTWSFGLDVRRLWRQRSG